MGKCSRTKRSQTKRSQTKRSHKRRSRKSKRCYRGGSNLTPGQGFELIIVTLYNLVPASTDAKECLAALMTRFGMASRPGAHTCGNLTDLIERFKDFMNMPNVIRELEDRRLENGFESDEETSWALLHATHSRLFAINSNPPTPSTADSGRTRS